MKKNTMFGCAALLLAALAGLAGCQNPADNTGEKKAASFSVSGTVTVIPAADLTAVSVELYKNDETEGEAIHPDTDGNFSFPDIARTKDEVYFVKAKLDGYSSAESDYFNVTGAVRLPALTLETQLPVLLTAQALEQDKITLTFDKAVIISGVSGITFSSTFLGSETNLAAAGIEKTGDTVWVIRLDRGIEGGETVALRVSGDAVQEKGSDRRLNPVPSLQVTQEWQQEHAVKVISARVQFQLGLIWFVFVEFDRNIAGGLGNADAMVLTGSESGVLPWNNTNGVALSTNPSVGMGMLLSGVSPKAGETLTLSYDKTISQVVAEDGTLLESFSIEIANPVE